MSVVLAYHRIYRGRRESRAGPRAAPWGAPWGEPGCHSTLTTARSSPAGTWTQVELSKRHLGPGPGPQAGPRVHCPSKSHRPGPRPLLGVNLVAVVPTTRRRFATHVHKNGYPVNRTLSFSGADGFRASHEAVCVGLGPVGSSLLCARYFIDLYMF